jgi:hypothetical protein
MAISRAQIPESIDMFEGGSPNDVSKTVNLQNERVDKLIEELRGRVASFDFDKEQQKYSDRLGQFVQQPDDYNIFDLATSISQGLSAQQQGQGPDSIGQGLAMGFNQASADMRERDRAINQRKQEIGLQAAKIAMQNEKDATDFLDKAIYELAKSTGSSGGTADITNYKFREGLDEEGKKNWDKMKNQDPLASYFIAKEEARGAREGSAPGGVDLTVAEEALDKEFGKIASEYTLKGGPQVAANLRNLQEKIEILQDGKLNVSGPIIGLLPDSAKGILSPDAASFQSDIRDVVFQSLREKLGAQFTEREGDRLVAAAFNSYLQEDRNVARLQRLYSTIEQAARSKQNAINYFNENGTLKGYDVPIIDFDSLMDDIIQNTDYEGMTDEELLEYFDIADKKEQDLILQMIEERETK